MAKNKWLTLANYYNLKNYDQPIWKTILDYSQQGIGSTRVTIPAIEGQVGKDEEFLSSRVMLFNSTDKRFEGQPDRNLSHLHAWSIGNARSDRWEYSDDKSTNWFWNEPKKEFQFQSLEASLDNDWTPHGKTYKKNDFLNDTAKTLYRAASMNLGLDPVLSLTSQPTTDLKQAFKVTPSVYLNEFTLSGKKLLHSKQVLSDIITETNVTLANEGADLLTQARKSPMTITENYRFIKNNRDPKSYRDPVCYTRIFNPENVAQIPAFSIPTSNRNIERAQSDQFILDRNPFYDLSNFRYNFGWFFYAESSDGMNMGWSIDIPDMFEYFYKSQRYYFKNENKITLDTIQSIADQKIINKKFLENTKYTPRDVDTNYNVTSSFYRIINHHDDYDGRTFNVNGNQSRIRKSFSTNALKNNFEQLLNNGINFQKQGYVRAIQGGLVTVYNIDETPLIERPLRASRVAGTNNWNVVLLDENGRQIPTVNIIAKPILVSRLKAIASLHGLSNSLIAQPFEDSHIGFLEDKEAFQKPIVTRQVNRENQFIEVTMDRIVDLDQTAFVNSLNRNIDTIQRNNKTVQRNIDISNQASALLATSNPNSPDAIKAVLDLNNTRYTSRLNSLLAIPETSRTSIQKTQIAIYNKIIQSIKTELFAIAITLSGLKATRDKINKKTFSRSDLNSLNLMLQALAKRMNDYKANLVKFENELSQAGTATAAQPGGKIPGLFPGLFPGGPTTGSGGKRPDLLPPSPGLFPGGKRPDLLPPSPGLFPGGSSGSGKTGIPEAIAQQIQQAVPLIKSFLPGISLRTESNLDYAIASQFALGLDQLVSGGLITKDSASKMFKSLFDVKEPLEAIKGGVKSGAKQPAKEQPAKEQPAKEQPPEPKKSEFVGGKAAIASRYASGKTEASRSYSADKLNKGLFGYRGLGTVVIEKVLKIKPDVLNQIRLKLKNTYELDQAAFEALLNIALQLSGLGVEQGEQSIPPSVEESRPPLDLIETQAPPKDISTQNLVSDQPIEQLTQDQGQTVASQQQDQGGAVVPQADQVVVMQDEAKDTAKEPEKSNTMLYVSIGAAIAIAGGAYLYSKNKKKK
jgi:hypothetical protein